MVEYFLGRVFEGFEECWVNTKSLHIPISFEDKNIGEVNKPKDTLLWRRVFNLLVKNRLMWMDLRGYPGIIPSKSGLVNNLSGKFWDTE
jgi:hypothetical protein